MRIPLKALLYGIDNAEELITAKRESDVALAKYGIVAHRGYYRYSQRADNDPLASEGYSVYRHNTDVMMKK